MRFSALLAPTLREVPGEAEVVSHQLLLRAGMIRRVAAGVYTYLPLGWRVAEKIMRIVRQEMDRAGGQELLLPIIQPAELWQATGRWDVYGPEMFRLNDRHGRPFCLGPTHEELITALVRAEVRSYRQLPLLLYQIQNKYRDERRPRFGLLRGREFIMKDLYSFDRDEAGMQASYERMYEAYCRTFSRLGLSFRVVEADPGAIGGGLSQEFMVTAATGEAGIVFCPACGYAADVDKAPCRPQELPPEEPQPPKAVPTPEARTVEEVAAYLGVPTDRILKTLFYIADGRLIGVILRGDRRLNEAKLINLLRCTSLEMAEDRQIEEATGSPPGFVGPVGLEQVPMYADQEVFYLTNAVAGANREGYHLVNVNPGRDFRALKGDLRCAEAQDPCPQCGRPLEATQGIEVGQIFQLGTKYSRALGATYLDERGAERLIVMGCYGIGISRTMAAAVEQHHDDAGIIWPASIAPYQAVVVAVNPAESRQREVAEALYGQLQAAGIEVVLDDRPERAGVKFADADLIGFPWRITVGRKAAEQSRVDVRRRGTADEISLPPEGVREYLKRQLTEEGIN
ncbi:MAG: proline--tRNA ligase [Clostridia bacterium]|jgi:prolyl-tRNA synthetase|nr:proline--tRNA ligase [Clostridia bacterium]MDH7572385.1 proline--tRNA ligase [Clostridia bacterium]